MQSSKLKLIVKSLPSGINTAKDILYKTVDRNTVLFLSGGKTPKDLYKILTEEKHLFPGAVGLVDERFGGKLHENSNEKTIQDTGFLNYLESQKIPFYPILLDNLSRVKTASSYEETVKKLFSKFKKRVAILGIGVDGHIAGIPTSLKFKVQSSKLPKGTENKERLVLEYNDEGGFYKERITMTLKALSEMDLLLVLVFGKEKKKALELLWKNGSSEEIPARFLKRPDIAKKTLLITDSLSS